MIPAEPVLIDITKKKNKYSKTDPMQRGLPCRRRSATIPN
jgi:hypothetical protein